MEGADVACAGNARALKHWHVGDGRPRLRGGLVGAMFHPVALLLTGEEGVAPRPLRRSSVFRSRQGGPGGGGDGGGGRLGSGRGLARAVLHPVALSLAGEADVVPHPLGQSFAVPIEGRQGRWGVGVLRGLLLSFAVLVVFRVPGPGDGPRSSEAADLPHGRRQVTRGQQWISWEATDVARRQRRTSLVGVSTA
ncbi:hypothetical protein NL676_036703 [Syzygium grande]|nr:hypothetical protein NL676_036703 [Syzygium grande]